MISCVNHGILQSIAMLCHGLLASAESETFKDLSHLRDLVRKFPPVVRSGSSQGSSLCVIRASLPTLTNVATFEQSE